jgi:hypothetical protein
MKSFDTGWNLTKRALGRCTLRTSIKAPSASPSARMVAIGKCARPSMAVNSSTPAWHACALPRAGASRNIIGHCTLRRVSASSADGGSKILSPAPPGRRRRQEGARARGGEWQPRRSSRRRRARARRRERAQVRARAPAPSSALPAIARL